MHNIYIGWDSREDIVYQVCEHSILSRTNDPTKIYPLKQKQLREAGLYWRDVDPLASTEFTFTRFLVPYLNNYNGWALFCDCDMLFNIDIKEIFDHADPKYAVQVVKHDYTPKPGVKMDGKTQTNYPRKNWSSLILWNCGHPSNRKLTGPEVNKQSGAFLHRFQWLDDSEIGKLSHEYNWLVGWYKEPNDGHPKVLHYTEGAPVFKDYRHSEYSEEFLFELMSTLRS